MDEKTLQLVNNRELSWLAFNERVMQEAEDITVPLIQRLRFLGIFSNNQDEFFRVRVASVRRLDELTKIRKIRLQGGISPGQLLELIQKKAIELQNKFESVYQDIINEMQKNNIFVVDETELSSSQKAFAQKYFAEEIHSQLIPIILNKNTDITFLRDDRLFWAVKLNKKGSKREYNRYFIIELPSSLPRFVVLPSDKTGKIQIIFLDDIIRLNLDRLFFMFNYQQIEAYTFKITRDAELDLDDDFSKSLIDKMRAGLRRRMRGKPLRMVYDETMPGDLLSMIENKLGLKEKGTMVPGGRYHQMRDLMKFPVVKPELEVQNPVPLYHKDLNLLSSIIKVIRSKDILLNYPYHNFVHVIDFLREAAFDPKVEEIYITLYRVADRSKIINALISAAKNGKKVVVMVELQARFDEKNNIKWTNELRDAGVKVIHGIQNLKVHSKLILIKRKENRKLKGYTYIGTGNFNENTAKLYTDFGLFTAHQGIAQDAERIFDYLQNGENRFECSYLLASPFYLRTQLSQLIEREIANARKGKTAYILLKINSLVDNDMIKLLYKASQSGVQVRMIIRGICCLKPGIKKLSNKIKAKSIVDKYLEHTRLMIFANGGEEKYFIGSADWMSRNLDRRVEVCTPVFDQSIQKQLKDIFEIQWSDNVKARSLEDNTLNNYLREGDEVVRSQVKLYDYFDSINCQNNK
ncbi:MAG: polyphosphate kinase 1 [Bacteroidales bacterium]|nr:polyphosphate kinase 1 [Bacteroidales bacterium]